MTAKKKLIRNIIISVVVLAILGAAYVFVLNWDVNEDEEQKIKELTYVVFEDTENISSVHIKNQSSEYDIVLTKSENGTVKYSVSGKDGRNVNELQLENTIMSLSQMVSNKTLSTDKSGLAEFGLATPQNSYTLNMKNGDEVTVMVGNEIPMSGEFYCMVKGGTEVYVVNSYSVSAVMAKPEDYISTAVFDFKDAMMVSNFTLRKNNQVIMAVCADEKNDKNNGNYMSSVWKMTYPWTEDVDNEKFTLLLNSIISVDVKTAADNVPEDVFDYAVEILAAEKSYKFSVGGTNPEGDVYFKYGEECYLVDSSIISLLENVNPDDYLVKLMHLVYMDDVENVTIGYDGKNYKLEPNDKNGNSYVVNGKSVDENQFKKLYQTLVGILYTQHTDIKTEEEPYLTIIYVYKGGKCEEIKFYKYDERSMVAIRPNGTSVMTLNSEIRKITDLLS